MSHPLSQFKAAFQAITNPAAASAERLQQELDDGLFDVAAETLGALRDAPGLMARVTHAQVREALDGMAACDLWEGIVDTLSSVKDVPELMAAATRQHIRQAVSGQNNEGLLASFVLILDAVKNVPELNKAITREDVIDAVTSNLMGMPADPDKEALCALAKTPSRTWIKVGVKNAVSVMLNNGWYGHFPRLLAAIEDMPELISAIAPEDVTRAVRGQLEEGNVRAFAQTISGLKAVPELVAAIDCGPVRACAKRLFYSASDYSELRLLLPAVATVPKLNIAFIQGIQAGAERWLLSPESEVPVFIRREMPALIPAVTAALVEGMEDAVDRPENFPRIINILKDAELLDVITPKHVAAAATMALIRRDTVLFDRISYAAGSVPRLAGAAETAVENTTRLLISAQGLDAFRQMAVELSGSPPFVAAIARALAAPEREESPASRPLKKITL